MNRPETVIKNLNITDIDDLIPIIVKDAMKLGNFEISPECMKRMHRDLKDQETEPAREFLLLSTSERCGGWDCFATYKYQKKIEYLTYGFTIGKDVINDDGTSRWVQLYKADYTRRKEEGYDRFDAYLPQQGIDYMNSLVDKTYGDELKGLLDL